MFGMFLNRILLNINASILLIETQRDAHRDTSLHPAQTKALSLPTSYLWKFCRALYPFSCLIFFSIFLLHLGLQYLMRLGCILMSPFQSSWLSSYEGKGGGCAHNWWVCSRWGERKMQRKMGREKGENCIWLVGEDESRGSDREILEQVGVQCQERKRGLLHIFGFFSLRR